MGPESKSSWAQEVSLDGPRSLETLWARPRAEEHTEPRAAGTDQVESEEQVASDLQFVLSTELWKFIPE